ncbi:hypothetical protein YTPLAS18_19660 [Nitrospira sp.]|nr:hypothetical protein YTPLAS18_19660 [Nitrospira sp.]
MCTVLPSASCRRVSWQTAWCLLLVTTAAGPSAAEPTGSPGFWLTGAPAPTVRSEVGAGVIDGKIYVIGGLQEPRGGQVAVVDISNTVEEYDPILNTWTAKAPLPARLHHPGVAVIDRKLYVVGGFSQSGLSIWSPVATLYRYDPVTDTWTERHAMPTARGALGVAVVGHKLVAIGGFAGRGDTGAVELYDPSTDSWITMAKLPTPRDHLAAATYGQDVCAIGGRLNRDFARNLAVVECWHSTLNRWERRADLPAPRSGHAAATLGRHIYVFGGESPEQTIAPTVAYRVDMDKWHTMAEMPTARHGLGTGVADNRIYAIGGGPTPGRAFSNVTEIYVPPSNEAARRTSARASAAHVGAVMAVLATWSEAGVLPPESTPDASRIVKALIQFQSAMMKSDHPQVRRFFEQAMDQKFGQAGPQYLQQGRTTGWTSRILEAVVEYGTNPRMDLQPALESGWREFNVSSQDLRLLASLHAAAKDQLSREGKDLHALYEEKRRLMPGAP